MSATLVAKGLAASFGARTLFTALDLVIAPGQVVGLIGANGAGKSTLLRLLAGERVPEQGSVVLTPETATVGYLPQEAERRPGETVLAFLRRRTGVAAADERLEVATVALSDGRAGADDEYSVAFERWLALGAADLDERAETALADTAPGVDAAAEMPSLSGGQAARVSLCSLLLSRYDAVLLDEPTNDLDLAGLALLERFVRDLKSGVVLVSHDREFLARTVDTVVEIDLAQQQVHTYGGGYTSYLAERETARRHAREEYEQYADTRGTLEERARTQRAWMEKGVRNARRKATDNDKFMPHFRGETAEKQAAKASQTDRMIERLEVIAEPRKEWELRMTIAAAPRAGAVVATLNSAVVRLGDFILGPATLQVDWADRIAVTGANGGGKTTLLRALLGQLPLDEGSSALGPGVIVGQLDQARAAFTGDATFLDTFGRSLPELAPAQQRTLLAKFGLRAAHTDRPTSSLSPGERTRAGLALLQARGVNLLVLDEPTNHLDLPAIEQLEAALETYPGTLLLVTHDRRMLEAVTTNRRWEVAGGQVAEAG